MDVLALGSDKSIRRLLAYYLILAAVVFALFQFVPAAAHLFKGDSYTAFAGSSNLLQDGLSATAD